MMVTFVSQCDKKAIARSRRVLDAFADRIGDNTWQTVITQEGLLAVKKLLRKTATKNTAVSCHWIRSRARSELIWVVGNKLEFNELGRVPVNTSKNDLLHSDWENHWHHAYSIQVLAALAALLHDLGKATVGFQNKLQPSSGIKGGDPYRHEWISLHIFLAMIDGCSDDEAWLKRLTSFSGYITDTPDWLSSLGEEKERPTLEAAPPLAQLIGWLIVTHHRLPFYDENYFSSESRKSLRANTFLLDNSITDFYEDLKAVDYWVKNPKSIAERSDNDDFWQLKAPIASSKVWLTAVARWANKALNHRPLIQLAENPISNPFIMHLSRLCLMIGDHNFSSLSLEQSQQVKGDKALKDELIANTDRKTGLPKQALDQHLLGVARFSAQFARVLPQLALHLPPIDKLKAKAFNKRTNVSRFQWQNRSFDLAAKLQEATQKQGFFGVNMASTGCGKTLANARIMHALADPKRGTRFTIALGLRVLTLQTGLALREKLDLDESSLAILVGSAASRKLFELNNETAEDNADENSRAGSESLAELVDETVKFGDSGIDSSILGTVIENPKARDLLFAPVVSCTIDHIINASENARGGKHIAPILRLLSSDLVLDEPDDFGQSDLPALSRLVHLAGMFGSRVLLSSATLTPDLTAGLFKAYQAGRDIWNAQTGLAKSKVVCAWFDENYQTHSECSQLEQFIAQQGEFVNKRVAKLAKEPPRRIGEILPISLPSAVEENDKINFGALAALLLAEAKNLHNQHHHIDKNTGKTASVGLIRCANIAPMVRVAQELFHYSETLENTEVHLCCYHARQLLVLRNSLETKLDRILDRSNTANLFDHPEIALAANNSSQKHHVFIVLATPVAEVGRDHDYDWAIVEPSSMRSIIQLAGRVWRHRPEKQAQTPNIKIMAANIAALKLGGNLGAGEAVFTRPGFEEAKTPFLLTTHDAEKLISEDQLHPITAVARITKPNELQAKTRLADLEHAVMADLFTNPKRNVVNAYWQSDSANQACVHLQRISPFREQTQKQDDYVCLPDDDTESGFSFYASELAWASGGDADTVNSWLRFTDFQPISVVVKPWLDESLSSALNELAHQLGEDELEAVALRYATVCLEEKPKGWAFNPLLGFWAGN